MRYLACVAMWQSSGDGAIRNGPHPWRRVLPAVLLPLALLGLNGCDDDDGTGPGSASGLAFVVSPISLGVGTPLAPPVSVAIRDKDGNTIVDWTESVTLTLEGGGAGMSLTGTTTQEPLAGLAIFPDLEISGAGTGLQLRAASGGLAAASVPFDVFGAFHAVRLTAGDQHTCALKADGTAFCFGDNSDGELGTGDLEARWLPTPVQTQVKFASISALGLHTCALSLDSEVYCWGDNRRGQLGDGTLEDRLLPQKVLLPGSAASVDVGFWHTCALLEDGDGYCWGENWGALGIGVADTLRVNPVRVMGDHDWVKIETGYLQTCGLTTQGEAYCWGPNVYGANGDGTLGEPRPSPTPVLGGHTFVDLVAGGGPCHGETCGITIDGSVLCWGKNYQRQIGPNHDISWTEPTPIQGDPGWVDVFIGPNMVCGHAPDGDLHCIGDAQYGIMDYTQTPEPMVPEMEVASIVQGQTHACILTPEGEAHCWGSNSYGQLGSQSQSVGWTSPVPVWAPPGG